MHTATNTEPATLTKGRKYDTPRLTHVGWRGPGGHQNNHTDNTDPWAFFRHDGTYAGPNTWGEEPIFTEAAGGGRVFVYGTLKAEHSNHHYVAAAEALGADTTRDECYDLFCNGGYPAMAERHHDELSRQIHGEVYMADRETLERMDRLEGVPSLYQRTVIHTERNGPCWAYLMPLERLTEGWGRWERCESGNWRRNWRTSN